MVEKLGDILKQQDQKRKDDVLLASRQKAARQDAERKSNEETLRRFLHDILCSVENEIMKNVPVTSHKIPDNIVALSGVGSWKNLFPDKPGHPFFDVYRTFADDVKERHALVYVFDDGHDGIGMSSWQTVKMVPAKS